MTSPRVDSILLIKTNGSEGIKSSTSMIVKTVANKTCLDIPGIRLL